jgi:hypothetical protein
VPTLVLVKSGTTQAHHGDQLTFSYSVQNAGTAPAVNVIVTDDHCAPVVGPNQKLNDDGDALLDPGETWI